MTPDTNTHRKGGRVRRNVRRRRHGGLRRHRGRDQDTTYTSAAIKSGEEYTVYTGGTAQVTAGLGEGSLDAVQDMPAAGFQASTRTPRQNATRSLIRAASGFGSA
jgi:hypothetical protein